MMTYAAASAVAEFLLAPHPVMPLNNVFLRHVFRERGLALLDERAGHDRVDPHRIV
jgi:hypothetical protein